MNEFFYTIPWRTRGYNPGAHPARATGPGYEFIGHRNLRDGADPRRLDIRASIRDPYQNWQIRVFTQRSAVPVSVIADVSSSMQFTGAIKRWTSLQNFILSTAKSATHEGDTFSLIAADDTVREELFIPPTHKRSVTLDIEARFKQFQITGRRKARALLTAAERLSSRKSLVFLVSDYHWAADFADTLFATLQGHDVVPVVLWDPYEVQVPDGRGLVRLEDSETGKERLLWLRPSLKLRWQSKLEARKIQLIRLLSRWGRPPMIFEGAFDPDRMTRYFHRQ